MYEIQAYIAEAMRVRRSIQIYSEFFDSRESLDILNNLSKDVTTIIRRSIHDEIIISLARLFDKASYKNKEHLSQKNITNNHKNSMNKALFIVENETYKLWQEISIQNYRNTKVAHNDKKVLIGDEPITKHNISYEKIVLLVETSIRLMIGLMASIAKKEEVEIWANINDKHIGIGNIFIQKIKAIQI